MVEKQMCKTSGKLQKTSVKHVQKRANTIAKMKSSKINMQKMWKKSANIILLKVIGCSSNDLISLGPVCYIFLVSRY